MRGTAAINGVRLHYLLEGQRPLVVLLHGWPQSWYCWRKGHRRLDPVPRSFQPSPLPPPSGWPVANSGRCRGPDLISLDLGHRALVPLGGLPAALP